MLVVILNYFEIYFIIFNTVHTMYFNFVIHLMFKKKKNMMTFRHSCPISYLYDSLKSDIFNSLSKNFNYLKCI